MAGMTCPPLLVFFISLARFGWAAQSDPKCRLAISDSGGASYRPVSFTSAEVTKETVAPDTFYPGDADSGGQPRQGYCAGPAGCEQECCARSECLAWGWEVAGSVHAVCGGQTCEVFLANPALWPVVTEAEKVLMWGGYNYGGYVFVDEAAKAQCCPQPPPQATQATPASDLC